MKSGCKAENQYEADHSRRVHLRLYLAVE